MRHEWSRARPDRGVAGGPPPSQAGGGGEDRGVGRHARSGEWGAPAFEGSGWLQQMTGPWNALAGMWEAWFDAAKSLSQERGLDVGKSLTRLFDPEFWRTGGFAP